jgi:hypothetical protein
VRANVYRSIESQNTFLGLAFPSEVLIVLSVFWGAMVTLTPGLAFLATVGAYALLRVTTMGRPPQFLQHYVLFQVRRARCAGRLSAATRAASSPEFPHAARDCRDVAAGKEQAP